MAQAMVNFRMDEDLKKSMEQLERDGHIKVKVSPSKELSDYILSELGKDKTSE